MCELLIRNSNASLGRVLAEKDGLVNTCVSSRDDQEYFCSVLFAHVVALARPKLFRRTCIFYYFL